MKTIRHGGTLAALVAGALLAGCGTMEKSPPGSTYGSPPAAAAAPAPGDVRLTLSGSEEVPPSGSSASGTGTVVVAADCSVTANITVTGMTATASHIHQGAAGANGGVIVPLIKTMDNTFIAPAGAKMNAEQCAAYKAGNTYVNVHSAAKPAGELRAQLKGR
jgi:hypothetical protein